MLTKTNSSAQLLSTTKETNLDQKISSTGALLNRDALKSEFVKDLQKSLLLSNLRNQREFSIEIRQHDLESKNQISSNLAANTRAQDSETKVSPLTASETQELSVITTAVQTSQHDGTRVPKVDKTESGQSEQTERLNSKAPPLLDDRHGRTPINKNISNSKAEQF